MAKVCPNVYKRKDGRFEGRYKKGRDGKKLIYGYVYGRTKKKVYEKLTKKELEYAGYEDNNSAAVGLSIGGWLYSWLHTVKEAELKSSSCVVYERQIKLHLIPVLGTVPLQEFKEKDVRRLLEKLKEKELSESTVLSICRLLRSALTEARDEGLIEKLPGKRVWPKPVKREEARCLEKKERTGLLMQAKKRNQMEIAVAMYTGLRLGETAGLKWKDVDFENGFIRVRRTIQRVPERAVQNLCLLSLHRTRLAVLPPKSRSSKREIPMVKSLADILKELWEKSRKNPEDYIFFGKNHPERPMDPRNLQRRFEKACKAAGIENAHFHTLRHTFAAVCMEAGFDVESIRCLLGHSSARITLDCYAHSTKNHRKEIMQKKFRIAV